jgi:hypothetical protein
MVPQPGVLEHGHGLGFTPDLQDLAISDVGLAGLQAEAHPVAVSGHDILPYLYRRWCRYPGVPALQTANGQHIVRLSESQFS